MGCKSSDSSPCCVLLSHLASDFWWIYGYMFHPIEEAMPSTNLAPYFYLLCLFSSEFYMLDKYYIMVGIANSIFTVSERGSKVSTVSS